MKGSIIGHLIRKDCRLNLPGMVCSVVGGWIALAVVQIGGETSFVIGACFFFIAIMVGASLLPMINIVNERKRHTLPFLMSLPVSATQYAVAKLVSTVGMFFIPWLTLAGTALWLILVRHALPEGAIPYTLILLGLPFVGFCLITAAAMVTEGEALSGAAMAVVNSTYWLAWYLLNTRYPDITRTWLNPTAVWNGATVNILASEAALIVVTLGLTLYIQSRKRDFVF
jgi:hypothetical protein